MPFKRLVTLIGCLLAVLAVSGQPQAMLFHHLTVNNGLSQGVNNCIFKDSRGYVWISSFDGLNRYDGLSCTIFREELQQRHSIQGTLFLNILEDQQGNLWIGSNKGLNVYNRATNQFDHYQMADRKPEEQVVSPFYIDNNGKVWLQAGSDILLFTPADHSFKTIHQFHQAGNLIIKAFPSAPFQSLQTLYCTISNHAQAYQGMVLPDHIDWAPLLTEESAFGNLTAVLPVNGGIWFGTANGLLYCSGPNRIFIQQYDNEPLSAVKSLTIDQKGTLWAGTLKQGLFSIDTGRKVITGRFASSARNPYSLSGNQVQYLYTDNENQLWVSVWGKGIDYTNLDKFRFRHYLSREEAEPLGINNFIRSITESQGTLWCGTQQSGILVLGPNKHVVKNITMGLPPAIEHLYKDPAGPVWAATFGGLFKIDPSSYQIQPVIVQPATSPVPNRQFNFITSTQDGALLASTNAGLYLLQPQQGTYLVTPVKGLPASDVYLTTYCDSNGLVFVSRALKGFTVGELRNDSFISRQNFPYQASIKCFSEYRHHTLWIGSTIGLIRFNKHKLAVEKIYTTHDGLSNQYIYGVLCDKDQLWMSSNAGINCLQLNSGRIQSFNTGDGLQSNEFNTYSFCRAEDGEFVFGGVNGLNAFYPGAIHTASFHPPLQLSAVQINDAPYKAEVNVGELRSIQLKPFENTLSFQFTVLDFNNPGSSQLYYTLTGYDKRWIAAANKSVIRYANLPPGDYVLQAKVVNAGQEESSSSYSLSISVATPWWSTWWAILLYALALALLLYWMVTGYLQSQLRKQQIIMEKELAIEQERTRMARELHDGLGSKLSGIKHSFSAFQQTLDLPAEQDNTFYQNIEKLNESILDLRNLSHSLSAELSLQHGLASALQDHCQSLRESGALPVVFNSLLTENIVLPADQSFHIFRIVQELLQNIIRHAQASSAIVQISRHHKKIVITVEDNGKGFDTSKKDFAGIGLSNIQARIRLLQGKISFRSAPGEGTTVDLEIPLSI